MALHERLAELLSTRGLDEGLASLLAFALLAACALVLAAVANWIAHRLLLRVAHALVAQTRSELDDLLAERGVFRRLAHFAPAIVIYSFGAAFGPAQVWVERLTLIYMMVLAARTAGDLIDAAIHAWQQTGRAGDRPLRGYAQVAALILYLVVAILSVSLVLDRSPWGLLTGLGAVSAVILLVFRDSILGFVASVQISSQDIVRLGDWIEMPKYGADGDVVDITLTSVKIRNFDKTISTIPTYALVSDAVKNWRGMSESGGRRIKRSIAIDLQSIRFLEDADVERLRRIRVLAPYLDERCREVAAHNREQDLDDDVRVNGRRLTNVGTFRAYVAAYLRSRPDIHHEGMTFLVRQLPPGPNGLPIEVYVFTTVTDWVSYEGIQADVFDHLLAAAREFDLRVYQAPSSGDLVLAARGLADHLAPR